MTGSICEGVPPVPTGGTFTVWDYLVFFITLVISAAIGIYYASSGGKQKTTAEYLLADRRMPAFPVALSIFATFMAGGTSLGTPAEIYMQGTMFWITVWSVMLTPIFGAIIFGPFFQRLKILSAFEIFCEVIHLLFSSSLVLRSPHINSVAFSNVGYSTWQRHGRYPQVPCV